MYDPHNITESDGSAQCEDICTKLRIKNDTISIEIIGTPTWGSFIPEVAARPKFLITVGHDLASMVKSEVLYEWQEHAWQ